MVPTDIEDVGFFSPTVLDSESRRNKQERGSETMKEEEEDRSGSEEPGDDRDNYFNQQQQQGDGRHNQTEAEVHVEGSVLDVDAHPYNHKA